MQWLYELLMSRQERQVVVQIMQLWLDKPKAFKVVDVHQSFSKEYSLIKSSDFSIEYNLSNGACKLGDLMLQTGWFAKKILRMFATQQALLSFHENAAKKLLADIDDERCDDLPLQSVIIRKLYKEKESTAPVVLKPPFTEDQIKTISGKKVTAKLRCGDYYEGVISLSGIDDFPIWVGRSSYRLSGKYLYSDECHRDIMEVKLEENI